MSRTDSLRSFVTNIKENLEALRNLTAYELDLFVVYILVKILDFHESKVEIESRPTVKE